MNWHITNWLYGWVRWLYNRRAHDCDIHPTAVIFSDYVSLGRRVRIGAHTVIGGPGFYFDRTKSPPEREDMNGLVAILDDVEIGHNCNVDRGRSNITEGTRICAGAKIDALCHIAHDCVIGGGAILAAGTVLGGHATVGDGARLGLSCTIRNRATVGAGAIVGMGAVVIHRVAPGGKKTVFGGPSHD